MTQWSVYKIVDGDVLLYVGMSRNVLRRFAHPAHIQSGRAAARALWFESTNVVGTRLRQCLRRVYRVARDYLREQGLSE